MIIKNTYKLALKAWWRIFIYLFLIMFFFSLFCLGMYSIDAMGFKVLLKNDFFYTFNTLMSALTYKFDIPTAVNAFQKMLHSMGAVFSNSVIGAILLILYFFLVLTIFGLLKYRGCGIALMFRTGYPDFYDEIYGERLGARIWGCLEYEFITVVYFLACVFGIYGLMLLLMKWGASRAFMYIVLVLVVLLCKTDKNALLSSILPRAIFERRRGFGLLKDEIASVCHKPKENYLSALILAVIQVSSTVVAGVLLHVWGFVLAYFINNFVYLSYGLMKYYYNSDTPYTFQYLERNITAETANNDENIENK